MSKTKSKSPKTKSSKSIAKSPKTKSKLPKTIATMDMECYCPLILEKTNPNKRDKNIVFVEKGHQYYINGDSNYISVTTIVHSIFPEFNVDGLIEKLKKNYGTQKRKW